MNETDLDREIRAILDCYAVHTHWVGTTQAKKRQYAVWARGTHHIRGACEQVIEPTTHAEAQEARKGLIAADILELFSGANA